MILTAYRMPDGIHKLPGSLLAAMLASLLLALLGPVAGAQASSSCPNEIYRTGSGATLPDCRAYELVSPPDKNGGEVDGGLIFDESTPPPPMQAASSGEAVAYASTTAFNGSNAASSMLTSQYLSHRGPTGWYTQAITPEQNMPGGWFATDEGEQEWSLFQGFSENLEHAFLIAYEPAPVPGAPANSFSPYLRDDADGSYQLLPNLQGDKGYLSANTFKYIDMSEDGKRVLFETISGAIEEWNEGQLEQVNLLESGQPPAGASTFFFNRLAPTFGPVEDGHSAISRGGSRVVWGALYKDELEVQEPQQFVNEQLPGGQRVVHGPYPGFVEAASAEDSVLFILDNGALKRYEVTTGAVSEIAGPTVEGVFGASEDGSYVYFLASGVLAQGASGGVPNIYVWHNGTIDFVASLNPNDYDFETWDFLNDPFASPERLQGFAHLVTNGVTRVSPNGRYFAFNASESLTGYDNVPAKTSECSETLPGSDMLGEAAHNRTGRCLEVYEYDAASGRLTCASCNQSGLPPLGNAVVPPEKHQGTMNSGWQTASVQQRYLADDGRLFFDSYDELLPQATNLGKANVYEYEPAGAGTCQGEKGCQALISSGTSGENSWFVDASESGNDVFFTTRQQLVAQDGDQAIDLYDARVDGGFAEATPPPCGGEACRPPVTPAPVIYQAPVSATFVGPGNPVQAVAPAVSVKTNKHTTKGRKHSKKGRGSTRKKRSPGARRAARGSRVRVSSRGRGR